MKRFFIFFPIFLTLFFPSLAWAAEGQKLVFPLPRGTLKVTNTYGITAGHSGPSSKFALDMQSSDITGVRCNIYGAPILAAKSGVVDYVKYFEGHAKKSFGTHVILKHPDGIRSWYAHMIYVDSLPVKKGDQVEQGQILGLMGDTGTVDGKECPWNDSYNYGTHLHFEMRDENNLAILAEPMRGESLEKEGQTEDYKGFVRGGEYKSGTVVLDPTGFWNQHAHEVPYRFQYDPKLSGPVLQESIQIQTLSPLQAKLNEATTFTVAGKNLTSNLDLNIEGCKEGDVTWLEGDNFDEKKFICTPTINLIGSIGLAGQKEAGELFGFHIDVYTNNNLYSGPPNQIKVEPPNESWPSQQRTLMITGNNLPYDLSISIPACESFTYAYRSSTVQKIICHLPKSIANSQGEDLQGAYTFTGPLQSQSLINQFGAEKAAELLKVLYSFNEDYRIGLLSVSPQNALYGQKTTFTFKGLNIGRAEAVFIERCADLNLLSRSKDEIRVECIPLVEKALFSPLMPDGFKYGEHAFVLKDQSEGKELASGKLKFTFQDHWIDSVTPLSPLLEQINTFAINGQNVPERVSIWLPECGISEAKKEVFYKLEFNCNLGIIGGNEVFQFLQNLAKTGDDFALSRTLKSQERLVEIKLPKELTGSGSSAITLYRGTLKPTLKGYENLLVEEPGTLKAEEERIQDVLDANGDYSGRFLKEVGWEKLGWLDERSLLSDLTNEQKEAIKTYDNYQLLNCSKKMQGDAQKLLLERANELPSAWLNVLGACAAGLNDRALPDTVNFSPLFMDK